MTPLRIAFAGTPEFAVSALRALVDSAHTVVGVLTQPDRPSGRGRKVTASPVKQAALEMGFPVSQPVTLKTEEGRRDLAAWSPNVLIVVAYGLILPREVLALPRLGCINIHASLLPRWRGAAPIQRAILAGDAQTGITIMQMDAGLDTGPMLLQRQVAIRPDDTSGTLHDRLAALGAEALLESLAGASSGRVHVQPQPAEGVTYAAKIDKAEALIDWTRDALDIDRQIRAFNPWPVAETRFAGEPLRIHSASAYESKNDPKSLETAKIDSPERHPGTIIGIHEDAIHVQCGRGSLALTSVQRPGRRPISALDFAHSCPIKGQRFG